MHLGLFRYIGDEMLPSYIGIVYGLYRIIFTIGIIIGIILGMIIGVTLRIFEGL